MKQFRSWGDSKKKPSGSQGTKAMPATFVIAAAVTVV